MTVQRSTFFGLLIALLFFLFSYFVYPNLVLGDVEHYAKAYNVIGSESVFDAYFIYRGHTGATDFLPPYIVKFFSLFITHQLYVSVLNFGLGFLMMAVFMLNRRFWSVADIFMAIFIICGYYTWVVVFGLERFKVSLIFLLVSFICFVRSYNFRSVVFLVCSVLSHLQSLTLIFPVLTFIIISRIQPAHFKYLVGLAVLFIALLMIISEGIRHKLGYYLTGNLRFDFKVYSVLLLNAYFVFVFRINGFSGKYFWALVAASSVFMIFLVVLSGERLMLTLFFMWFFISGLSGRYFFMYLFPWYLFCFIKGTTYLSIINAGGSGF